MLEEAKRNYDEALLKSRWLDELAKRAKDKARLAERLCDAKYKRAAPAECRGARTLAARTTWRARRRDHTMHVHNVCVGLACRMPGGIRGEARLARCGGSVAGGQ